MALSLFLFNRIFVIPYTHSIDRVLADLNETICFLTIIVVYQATFGSALSVLPFALKPALCTLPLLKLAPKVHHSYKIIQCVH